MDFGYEWAILRSYGLDRTGLRMWAADRRRVWGEKALLWIGRHLPKTVRYWATIVSCAEATQGQWGGEHPDSVSIMTMLERVGG